MCVFARQDLTRDPPFSRLDLISCRNVLIYMGSALQQKAMAIFHYALKPTGFLMLGKSESVGAAADLFTLIDRQHRICSKVPAQPGAAFDLSNGERYEEAAGTPAVKPELPARFDVLAEADRIVLGQYAPAGLVVDENLRILHFRGQSSLYLSPPPGKASLDLLRMVRPEFVVELRTAVQRARKQDIVVRKEGIQVRHEGHFREVAVEVVPIKDEMGARFFLVVFQDTPSREPATEETSGRTGAGRGRQALEGARLRRKLQRAEEHLQLIIQDQEATTEELKSANEEALSSNEELESTNEELETAKEELQSTNEELVTVNEQLQTRNVELTKIGDDVNNLIGALNIPVLMLSGDLRIRNFTPQAEKLLNLLPGDVGRPIDHIRANIDLPDLASLVAEVVDSGGPRERDVQDQQGAWYSMRIRPYLTTGKRIDGAVVIFVDVDRAKRIHVELQREQSFSAAVLESAAALVMVTDIEGHIVRFNRACRKVSGYSFEEVAGKSCWEVLLPPEEVATVKQIYKDLAAGRAVHEHETQWLDREDQRHLISWHAAVVAEAGGVVQNVVRIGVDVTAARQAEDALQPNEKLLRQSQTQLRALTTGLLEAQEEERRRISRELHDDIGQRMAALSIQVEVLQQVFNTTPDEVQRKLSELRNQLEVLSEDLRRTAHDLHPFLLTHLGLEPALRAYCQEFSGLRPIRVRFVARGLPEAISPEAALCAYRVVQEALGNAARHSGAKRAIVTASGRGGALHVAIRDNGRGFDLDEAQGKGLGLVSMEERVRRVGGTLSITSAPGEGTRAEIQIPCSAKQSAETVESAAP
jgi:two-component system CheB/CheR fusion protein